MNRKHITVNGVETNAERHRIVAAVLDAIEDGASRHCLRMTYDADEMLDTVEHHRLGVAFTFHK